MGIDYFRNPFWLGALTLVAAFIVVIIDGHDDAVSVATPIAVSIAFAAFFTIAGVAAVNWWKNRHRHGHE